jgi:Uma2 family endonuclease
MGAGFVWEDLPADDRWPRHELVDGVLLVTPVPNLWHQAVTRNLLAALAGVTGSDLIALPGANVIPDEANLLIPDVLVVDSAAVTRDALGVAPRQVRLVIEVESPSTRRVDRILKRGLYDDYGVPSYWVADPVGQSIDRFGGTPTPRWAAGLDLSLVFA